VELDDGTYDCGTVFTDDPWSWGDPLGGFLDDPSADAIACTDEIDLCEQMQAAGNPYSNALQAAAAMETVINAERAAADRLFTQNCAGLFLTPAQNTPAARAQLSQKLDSLMDNGNILMVNPFKGVGPDVPAIFLNGNIDIFNGRAFWTGPQNGNPVFSGLSLSQFQQLIIIHEFMHAEGVVGNDNAGQSYTLPNGDIVKSSLQISAEVKNDCFN
jgi:hypothetical protein